MKRLRPPCSSQGHVLSPREAAVAKRLGVDPRRFDIHQDSDGNKRFRCPRCRLFYCWRCEGRDEGDPYLDQLCDTCWARAVERRKKRRAA